MTLPSESLSGLSVSEDIAAFCISSSKARTTEKSFSLISQTIYSLKSQRTHEIALEAASPSTLQSTESMINNMIMCGSE
jgi:hypothetical protein